MWFKCTKCKKHKPLWSFNLEKRSKDLGIRSICKVCNSKYYFYKKTHYQKYFREKNKTLSFQEIRRNSRYLSRYGITVEDYEKLLETQNHSCIICDSKDPGRNHKYFCVDHNHNTGEVRGLLCFDCNVLLGFAKDDISILKSAINYLEKE